MQASPGRRFLLLLPIFVSYAAAHNLQFGWVDGTECGPHFATFSLVALTIQTWGSTAGGSK